MSGLGHHLEREGIATTILSLIRLHTERMRPPRALWVPFELGRPLGPPDDPAGQEAVLRRALALLERDGPEPVLEDLPDRRPAPAAAWQPPELPAYGPEPVDAAQWQAALAMETAALYDRWQARRRAFGRSTFGVAGLKVSDLPAFMAPFAAGAPEGGASELKQAAQSLRYAADDLKAFVMEAADDGPAPPPPGHLANWFWDRTAAGGFLFRLREVLSDAEHPRLKAVGAGMLVPGVQLARRQPR